MTTAPNSILASMVGFACLAVMSGCEVSYDDKNRNESDKNKKQQSEEQTATSTDSSSGTGSAPSINSSDEPGFRGNTVAGNPADAGAEIYRANWQGHDVRCLGADYDRDGYFMSDVIDETEALELGKNGTATGHNFISPRTGLHYRFRGFREGSANSKLIKQNPHAVTPGSGTLRCYWNPVEGL